ncbi:phosphoglycerate kinase [Candidatus Babeliales bacterium]|nr:phosphoglycerate kinase [Candidatus Babeliales bacterium]
MKNFKTIKNLNLKNKRVLLRADLNVPTKNKEILQDYRLKEIIPTINYIQKNGGKVILATHIGRPEAGNQINFFDKNLSTKILVPWFEKENFNIKLEKDLIDAQIFSKQDFNQILLLENLRFFNGEQGEKHERERLAQLLVNLADIYVNDAFALIHRDDTSITLLPNLFEQDKKAVGLLIEKEITELNKLKDDAEQPFMLVLGGNKVTDKIKLLESFLKDNSVNTIIIGGAIANTFLKSQGYNVGKSLVEKDLLDFAKNFINSAQEQNIEILLPIDLLAVENLNRNYNIEYFDINNIPSDRLCVDIGPKTIEFFKNKIKTAKTIFTNGSMGIYSKKEFSTGSFEILKAIGKSQAYSVAGGGDCVAAIYQFNLQNEFDFLSTGGGATLTYLSTENLENLPGLHALISK